MKNIFANIEPNEPVASLEGYFISLYGKSKVGKTTFIYDLIKKHYDGDFSKAIILATEIGYKTLRGVHALNISGFLEPEFEADNEEDQHLYGFGFVQAVDQLIELKEELPYRLAIIDTLTALQRYAAKYVVEEQGIKDDKDYSNIGDIPWGGGYQLLQDTVYEQIDRLKKNGFGVLTVSHDKTKTIEPKVGAKWDYTTLNLETKVADIVVREADINMYADLITKSTPKGGVEVSRQLVMRSGGEIEVGTRFANMPDTLPFSADAFLDAFEKAVLGLYDGDETAVKTKKDTEKVVASKQRVTGTETTSQAPTAEELQSAIKEVHLNSFKEAEDLAQMKDVLKGNLGTANYLKVDDVDALANALGAIKELAEELGLA